MIVEDGMSRFVRGRPANPGPTRNIWDGHFEGFFCKARNPLAWKCCGRVVALCCGNMN